VVLIHLVFIFFINGKRSKSSFEIVFISGCGKNSGFKFSGKGLTYKGLISPLLLKNSPLRLVLFGSFHFVFGFNSVWDGCGKASKNGSQS
jgi:hypothetical protein